MIRAGKRKNRGNLFTPFMGCAQIYHQRWYVHSPRGAGCPGDICFAPTEAERRQFHLHGLLRSALSVPRKPKGEKVRKLTYTIPLRKRSLLPFSELCVQTKAKGQPLSAHKVYTRHPLPYRHNVGVVYG
jgi:hypothetical protein